MDETVCPFCGQSYDAALWTHLEDHGLLVGRSLPPGILFYDGRKTCPCGRIFNSNKERAKHFYEHGQECLLIGILTYG
jgi:hypothetical protein